MCVCAHKIYTPEFGEWSRKQLVEEDIYNVNARATTTTRARAALVLYYTFKYKIAKSEAKLIAKVL